MFILTLTIIAFVGIVISTRKKAWLSSRLAHGALVFVLLFAGMNAIAQQEPHAPAPTSQVVLAADGPHVAGCLSSVRLQGSIWRNNLHYVTWHGVIPHDHTVRVSGMQRYWYCPNKRYPNKVRPRSIRWCFNHHGAVPLEFTGVKYNAFIYSRNGFNVNPDRFTLHDDWDSERCLTQHISPHKQAWLPMGYHPRWRALITIMQRSILPDYNARMQTSPGHYVRFIHPHKDYHLTGWIH